MRGSLRQAILFRLRAPQPELRRRRLGIDLRCLPVMHFRLRRIARCQQRFRQMPLWTKLFRLQLHRGVEKPDSFLRALHANQQDAQIELRLIQPRFQIERFLVFRYRLGVLSNQAVGERQMEMRGVVFWIRLDGLREQLRGLVVLLSVERLQALRLKICCGQK